MYKLVAYRSSYPSLSPLWVSGLGHPPLSLSLYGRSVVNTNFDRHKKKKKKMENGKRNKKKSRFQNSVEDIRKSAGMQRNAAESTEMENGIMHNPNRTRLGLELCMCGGPHCNLFQWLKAVSEND